jgi:glycosyltransferase involved in cell wall biosynthesis
MNWALPRENMLFKLPDISIVTPNYNMRGYLERCHASILDQDGISWEHIVIDGGSTDGTVEWLKKNNNIRSISEEDKGMYDAINKGLLMAKGNIFAYLNCDEQYLPGTLSFIKDYFAKNPRIDLVFGSFLLIGPDGSLLSFRKAQQPRWFYVVCDHLYVYSCAMFFRRRIIDDAILFNSDLRTIGDAEFVVKVMRKGYRASYVKRYLAAFTLTGNNMLLSESAKLEKIAAWKEVPIWLKAMKYPMRIMRIVEKAISGAYFEKMPIKYGIYDDDLTKRCFYSVSNPSPLWPANIR